MVHQSIDGGGRGHLIAKDAIPLAEHEITRHHHRAALVALGEQRKEHFGFFGTLLHVAEIIDQDHLEEIKLAQRARQLQIALRTEQLLHHGVRRREEHAVAGFDQRVRDRAERMTFADTG